MYKQFSYCFSFYSIFSITVDAVMSIFFLLRVANCLNAQNKYRNKINYDTIVSLVRFCFVYSPFQHNWMLAHINKMHANNSIMHNACNWKCSTMDDDGDDADGSHTRTVNLFFMLAD